MNDIYPVIIHLTSQICWCTFVRLQQVNKYFLSVARGQCQLLVDNFVNISYSSTALCGGIITLEEIASIIEFKRLNGWWDMTNAYHHVYLPLTVHLWDDFGRYFEIDFGSRSLRLQLYNDKYIWIKGVKYQSQHAILVNFLRIYLPSVHSARTSADGPDPVT